MGVGVSDVACQQSIYAREREQRAEGVSCGVQGSHAGCRAGRAVGWCCLSQRFWWSDSALAAGTFSQTQLGLSGHFPVTEALFLDKVMGY